MTEPMRVHNEAFQDGVQSLVSHKSDPAVEPFHDPTAIGSKTFRALQCDNFLPSQVFTWMDSYHTPGRKNGFLGTENS